MEITVTTTTHKKAASLIAVTSFGLVVGCGNPTPSFKEEAAVGKFPGSLTDNGTDGRSALEKGEFVLENTQKSKLNIKWQSDYLSQDFDVAKISVEKQFSLFQAIGEARVDKFTQTVGTNRNLTENFTQEEEADGVLDIAIVVDNSGSMREEQVNLSDKLSPLLSYISETDWRIGVTTTDPRDGCLREGSFIGKHHADSRDRFSRAVMAGTSGSGNERGILQAIKLLNNACDETPWIRDNSSIAVLIVSDEDNCQEGTRCPGDDKNASALVNQLDQMREAGTNARVYGLIWDPADNQSQCRTGFTKGRIYKEAITNTHGVVGSICANDYTDTLRSISQHISGFLKKQFTLRFAPKAGTLAVRVNGRRVSNYTLAGNVVTFDSAPNPGASVAISYEYESSEPTRFFTLSGAADPASIRVTVDGAATTGFTFDEASKQLTFAQIPGGENIAVNYRAPADRHTSFALTGLDTFAIKTVLVNDKAVASTGYTQTQTGITFASAPAAGAEITVVVDALVGYHNEFRLLPGASLKSVIDLERNKELAYTTADGIMTVSVDGLDVKTMRAEYSHGKAGEPIRLAEEVKVDEVVGESGACTKFKVERRTDGRYLDLSPCGFTAGEKVSVFIEDAGLRLSNIQISVSQAEDLANGVKGIYANGTEVTDYTLKGTSLTINAELPLGARIEIKAKR